MIGEDEVRYEPTLNQCMRLPVEAASASEECEPHCCMEGLLQVTD
jgi:hypothetical protein